MPWTVTRSTPVGFKAVKGVWDMVCDWHRMGCSVIAFQENLSQLYCSVSGLNLLKMIDLKPSNIMWICYTAYRQIETRHTRSIDTKLFFFASNCMSKFTPFCLFCTNFQSYRRTYWDLKLTISFKWHAVITRCDSLIAEQDYLSE